MNKTPIALMPMTALSGCGLVKTQAVYEEIRAQEKAKTVGNRAVPASQMPIDDQYQKERSVLLPAPN